MYQYQVSFGDAIGRAFNKYCCFTGRASRSEYWWFTLFNLLVSWGLSFISLFIFGYDSDAWMAPSYLWSFVVLLPGLGLLFRRLHDTGHSGWNILWFLLPVAGFIIILVYLCQDSQMTENQYGPVPNLRY